MTIVYNKTGSNSNGPHSYYKSANNKYGISEWIENKRGMGPPSEFNGQTLNKFNQHLLSTKNTIRLWKCHAPLQYLPCKSLPKRMIIVTRNPKDTLVSYYHHVINGNKSGVYNFDGTFNEMLMIWCLGLVENNSWFTYYKDYWRFYTDLDFAKKDKDVNILWLNYEDFVVNDDSKREQIWKLIRFLQVDDMVEFTEKDVDDILINSSVKKMKKQYEGYVVKDFIRKGVNGDWKNYLNDRQNEIMDNLIRVHFNDTEFKYFNDLQDGAEYICTDKSVEGGI